MKIYLVGGAVRDQLLGLPVKERDFVVVGANIDDMLGLGYQQVGKDFPVFLHPDTHEEYALARMERKVKPGYKGFTTDSSPNVTLEEDLLRRDLTINAMALDADTQQIIDPYGGQQDLAAKILRHVSPAFAEDPVRILRVGRFLARYAGLGFQVAPETSKLMSEMVVSGEAGALIAERVWKELERALGEAHPDKFFEVLENAGALPILFPALLDQDAKLDKTSAHWQAFLKAIALSNEPIIRFAALMHATSHAQITALANRYRLPNQYRELITLTARHYAAALVAKTLTAEDLLTLFNSLDIYRRPARFEQFLTVCVAIAKAREIEFDPAWLLFITNTLRNIDIQELLSQGLQGQDFANALRSKRLAILMQHL